MRLVRVMMVGDVVGTHGLEALEAKLPALIKEHSIDLVTVNGENSAEGFGMTDVEFKRIISAGADIITSGNHIWEKREFWSILENDKNMLRPANYPNSAPGTGFALIQKNNVNWLIINLQGRELMTDIDCPFQCLDRIIEQAGTGQSVVTIIDFHAESSREKEALAYYADGRVSLFAGTHTHIQTADERILPNGCAYITDLGMTGITESVIGMDPKICQDRFTKQVQYQMKTVISSEQGHVNGVIAEIDADTGKAVSVRRIPVSSQLSMSL